MKWFVAVSGNIGSGKSTVTTLLCERLGWKPYYEIVEENPYLADFYADMRRWSFHVQVFFLSKRFQHHQEIAAAPGSIVQDRTIYENYEQGISAHYLAQLNERYKEWSERFSLCPILTVDADDLDLSRMDRLVAEMQLALRSLFPLVER